MAVIRIMHRSLITPILRQRRQGSVAALFPSTFNASSTPRIGKRLPRTIRSFGTNEANSGGGEEKPLLLWITGSADGKVERNYLLLPSPPQPNQPVSVDSVDDAIRVNSVEDVVAAVNKRYNHDDVKKQFVGGMGETDPGVWFAGIPDALDHAEFIQNSVAAVKQERHGVPFGVYTTGIVTTNTNTTPDLTKLGVSTFRVSLFAANPLDYEKVTNRSKDDFNAVCSFIAVAAEQGVAVEAAVKKEYAAPARDLALSLGAQDVLVYD